MILDLGANVGEFHDALLGRFTPKQYIAVEPTPETCSPMSLSSVSAKKSSEGRAVRRTSVDIGGESTRPGSDGVSADAELRRVEPVLEGGEGLRVRRQAQRERIARCGRRGHDRGITVDVQADRTIPVDFATGAAPVRLALAVPSAEPGETIGVSSSVRKKITSGRKSSASSRAVLRSVPPSGVILRTNFAARALYSSTP